MVVKRRQPSLITAEFFIHSYRISGSFYVRTRSLGDALYDSTTSYLTLADAYISPISAPTKITARQHDAVIVKSAISFTLTMTREDALRRDQRYGSYSGPQFKPIYITLPFFELEGLIRLPGRLDPIVLLSSRTEAYLTLIDVTARLSLQPEITYHGEAALVNKHLISMMGLRSQA